MDNNYFMFRKTITIFIIMICVLPLAFASDIIPYEEVKNDWVIAFMEKYTENIPPDEFVMMVDYLDEIWFEYDKENDVYSTMIRYSDGNLCVLEFLYMQVNMLYVDMIDIPSEMKADVLEVINYCQNRDYRYALGTVILDENTLGVKYITLADGVTDIGEWLFWHFYVFESYSRNIVDEITIRLGLRNTFFW